MPRTNKELTKEETIGVYVKLEAKLMEIFVKSERDYVLSTQEEFSNFLLAKKMYASDIIMVELGIEESDLEALTEKHGLITDEEFKKKRVEAKREQNKWLQEWGKRMQQYAEEKKYSTAELHVPQASAGGCCSSC